MEQTRPDATIGDSEMTHELWFYWGYGVPFDLREYIPSSNGKQLSPMWEHIEFHLNEIRKTSGTARLRILKQVNEAEQTGKLLILNPNYKTSKEQEWYEISKELELMVDDGKFILNFAEDDDKGTNVISYRNPNGYSGYIDILGDYWDGRMICKDFDITIKYFKEFFETGDITKDHFL
jgi:hypothetical protein